MHVFFISLLDYATDQPAIRLLFARPSAEGLALALEIERHGSADQIL